MAKAVTTNLIGRKALPQPWVLEMADRKLWPFPGVLRADGTLAPGEIVTAHVDDGAVYVSLRSVIDGACSKLVPLAWLRTED